MSKGAQELVWSGEANLGSRLEKAKPGGRRHFASKMMRVTCRRNSALCVRAHMRKRSRDRDRIISLFLDSSEFPDVPDHFQGCEMSTHSFIQQIHTFK